jgi:hypothetical protein
MALDALGYTDTPMIPGSDYRVHDITRPQPRIVTPGSESSQATAGAAPSDAIILFDGSDLSGWESVSDPGKPAGWKIGQGYMEVVPGAGGIRTKTRLGDGQYHVEFATPEAVVGDSQGRGNSGVFLMELYEFQVLDCYNNPTYADGTTGAIYGQTPPLVNACRKPGEWQTYEIIWNGPRFDGRKVRRPASVTVLLNGVLLHHKRELIGPTSHKVVTGYEPHPEKGPLMLQDHKNPVRFRNIWHRPLTDYDQS